MIALLWVVACVAAVITAAVGVEDELHARRTARRRTPYRTARRTTAGTHLYITTTLGGHR